MFNGKDFLSTAPVVNRRLIRSQSELLRRLKGYINTHFPGITLEIYKFAYSKDDAISFLKRRADVPFVIRSSSPETSCYFIDSRNLEGEIEHHLIDLSEEKEEPQISLQVMGILAGTITLSSHIKILMAQSEADENKNAAESYFSQSF